MRLLHARKANFSPNVQKCIFSSRRQSAICAHSSSAFTTSGREDHGVFMRKAFLCQAAPPPFQVPPRTKYAKIRKEGAGNGEICWPLKEMPQFRRDVQQATVCYESTDYSQRGALSRGKRHTQC